MGYRAGLFFDPRANTEDTISRLCVFLETGSGSALKVRYRDQCQLVVGRKRMAVFVVALMISTLVPGPGFLLGYWFIYRNLKWRLALALEPSASGCLVRWSLSAPIDQGEMDARFASASLEDELPVALALLRTG